MKKLDKHFTVTKDLNDRIRESAKKNNRTYSEELNYIINKNYEEEEKVVKLLFSLNSDVKFVIKKMNILFDLLMQVYADLNFDNIQDVKTSYSVTSFLSKIKDDKYDN